MFMGLMIQWDFYGIELDVYNEGFTGFEWQLIGCSWASMGFY